MCFVKLIVEFLFFLVQEFYLIFYPGYLCFFGGDMCSRRCVTKFSIGIFWDHTFKEALFVKVYVGAASDI